MFFWINEIIHDYETIRIFMDKALHKARVLL